MAKSPCTSGTFNGGLELDMSKSMMSPELMERLFNRSKKRPFPESPGIATHVKDGDSFEQGSNAAISH
eukprot:6326600-Pyramimonas_sp.AAC.1